MLPTSIESFLERRIGLSTKSVGESVIRKAVQRRMNIREFSDPEKYLACIRATESECNALIEAVVIPETWFFRVHKSFFFLSRYVKNQWLPKSANKVLRVLSLPCSTGEEPYSIAITLLEAGLPPRGFRIDALDISSRALNKATRGVYGRESFRENAMQSLRKRYFNEIDDGFAVHPHIRESIRFFRNNLMNNQLPAGENHYQVIFCRNLMIYLNSRSQARAITRLSHMLEPEGILFVGHAERSIFKNNGF